MSLPEPTQFAALWTHAWNARDVEAVLAHYSEDVVFTSPVASRIVPDSGGVVRGKKALRQYWNLALESNTDLQFELLAVYIGVNAEALHERHA